MLALPVAVALSLLVEALVLLDEDALLVPAVALPVRADALLFVDGLSLMQSVSAVPCNPAHEAGGIDAFAAGVGGGGVLLVVVPVV